MGQRHKHADVIIAWAEGKDVQVWNSISNRWQDMTLEDPTFCGKSYRIKPLTRKLRVAMFKNHNTYVSTAKTPEDAKTFEASDVFVRWLTDWIEYEE